MNPEFPSTDDDRYLVIDDTDEDITQILTVVCEAGARPPWLDAERGTP